MFSHRCKPICLNPSGYHCEEVSVSSINDSNNEYICEVAYQFNYTDHSIKSQLVHKILQVLFYLNAVVSGLYMLWKNTHKEHPSI